jgi:hypothetical protein
MIVNGFRLPDAFVQLCEAIQRGEAPYEWELKEDVDAYGQPWEVADLRVLAHDQESIQAETDWIAEAYLHENRFQQGLEEPPPGDWPDAQGLQEPPPGDWPDAPGFILDFTGVAHFVWLGSSTSGETYAFDFGTDPKEPSVVYWDGYWRRVAPNFKAFMALFVPERVDPAPRVLLREWALKYVIAPREDNRPRFSLLPGLYANVSPEERRAVEAEVREELERMGMTDDQRRRLDELWARLHATHRSN